MKSKMTLLALFLLIGTNAFAQQPIRGAKPNGSSPQNPNTDTRKKEPNTQTVAIEPDLVVTDISYEKANAVRVRVLNQGNGEAKPCYLALMVMKENSPNSSPLRVWSVPVPALKARKGYSTTINIAPFMFVDHAFLARVDRSDQVKESDESNNDRFDNSKVIH